MKLTDMRNDPDDILDAGDTPRGPDYPPGLRLVLEEDALDRLDLNDVAVGDVVSLAARAKIVGYSETAGDDDSVACRLELQITDLGVTGDPVATRSRRDDERLDA